MKTRRAFTLVEITVALAVTSILVVLMLRALNDSSVIWQRSGDRLDTLREARAAIQIIARDLAGVASIPRIEGVSGSMPDILENLPVLALHHHPDGNPEDRVNGELYALTSIPNGGRSRICSVGYFCEWDPKRVAFVLRRQASDSDATHVFLAETMKAGSVELSPEAAFGFVFRRITDANDANAARHSIESLATFVWDLQFGVGPADAAEEPLPAPGFYSRELPEWVEIRFKALGANAVRKLEERGLTRETWFDPASTTYQNFILPQEQQFVTRVKLRR